MTKLCLFLVLSLAFAGCERTQGENTEEKQSESLVQVPVANNEWPGPCLDIFYNLNSYSYGFCPHPDHQIEFQKDDSGASTRNDDEDRYPTIICRCARPTENKIATSATTRPISPFPPNHETGAGEM
jgi:hypothetical protein